MSDASNIAAPQPSNTSMDIPYFRDVMQNLILPSLPPPEEQDELVRKRLSRLKLFVLPGIEHGTAKRSGELSRLTTECHTLCRQMEEYMRTILNQEESSDKHVLFFAKLYCDQYDTGNLSAESAWQLETGSITDKVFSLLNDHLAEILRNEVLIDDIIKPHYSVSEDVLNSPSI
jgi:hypothetical protein